MATGRVKGFAGFSVIPTYREGKVTACVLPQAPLVMLRWNDEKQGLSMVARKIALNGPVPSAASVLPKGVQWTKKPYDDADFILGIWALKKQTEPEGVPAGQLARFAVGYLASPAGTAGASRNDSGMGAGDEPAPDDESGEGEPSGE